MAHGDDKGLIIPPKVAPIHVAIVPIIKESEQARVLEACDKLAQSLRAVQYEGEPLGVKIDDREGFRPGYKYAHWELRGVPIRLEVGPRDIDGGTAMLVERLSGNKSKLTVDYSTGAVAADEVTSQLNTIQQELYAQSRTTTMERIHTVDNYDEFRDTIAAGRGWVLAPYDGDAATEARVKEETSATTRVLLDKAPEPNVKCLFSGNLAKHIAYWGASY
jgi:prolyl-tRNA synthetase